MPDRCLHESPLRVQNGGFDQHARDLCLFDDVVGLEDHAIARVAPEGVGGLHGDFPPLERVLVHPFHDVRRTVGIGLEQLPSTKNRTGPTGPVVAPHLRDDADRARRRRCGRAAR